MAATIGFDTATDDTAVAATRDGEAVYSRSLPPGDSRPQHATSLLVEVEAAAEAAGGWAAVGRLAVGVGPGSFTGLRIGIATAKSLAHSLGLVLAPVFTTAALARGAAGDGRPVIAALDARRGEVFAALYEPGGDPVWEPFACSPEELAGWIAGLAEPPLTVGSGAVRFRNDLQMGGAEIPEDADPRHRIAAEQTCAIGSLGEAVDPEGVAPVYLRPPDAERWRERDHNDT